MASIVDLVNGDVKGVSRRAKAEATRQRILDAALVEFTEKGFHGATVSAVAKRAGVAQQTVYFVFHSKPVLISAVIDRAVVGEEELPPEMTPWWAAMVAETDAAETLRSFVRGAAPSFQRASAISEVLRAAVLADDEVRLTHERHEALRRVGFRTVVDLVASKAPLRRDLTGDTATDVLLTMFGDSNYHMYVAEHGWSHDQVVGHLCVVLPLALLEQ